MASESPWATSEVKNHYKLSNIKPMLICLKGIHFLADYAFMTEMLVCRYQGFLVVIEEVAGHIWSFCHWFMHLPIVLLIWFINVRKSLVMPFMSWELMPVESSGDQVIV
jgi:hypothetical protein